MSTLFQITDSNQNVLNIRVYRNVTSSAYSWKPEVPGKVKATPDHDSAAARTGPPPGGSGDALECDAVDYDGKNIPVLVLYDCFTAGLFFQDAGTGWLYWQGVTTMIAGPMDWKTL